MEIFFNAISENRIPKGKSFDRIVGRSMRPEPPINPALRPLNIPAAPENANFQKSVLCVSYNIIKITNSKCVIICYLRLIIDL